MEAELDKKLEEAFANGGFPGLPHGLDLDDLDEDDLEDPRFGNAAMMNRFRYGDIMGG